MQGLKQHGPVKLPTFQLFLIHCFALSDQLFRLQSKLIQQVVEFFNRGRMLEVLHYFGAMAMLLQPLQRFPAFTAAGVMVYINFYGICLLP